MSEEEKNTEDIHTGTVIWFNVSRGFGFIRDHVIGDDLFCHYSKIDAPLGEFRMLDGGDEVQFQRFVVDRGDKRKNQAKNVKIIKKSSTVENK